MGSFRWVEGLSVGVEEFDEAHRQCISLLEDVEAAIEDGRIGQAGVLCDILVHAMIDHCRREEVFLRRIGYPGIDVLVEAQNANVDRLRGIATGMAEDPQAAARLAGEMRAAMVDYLLRGDINYKSYVDYVGASGEPDPDEDDDKDY